MLGVISHFDKRHSAMAAQKESADTATSNTTINTSTASSPPSKGLSLLVLDLHRLLHCMENDDTLAEDFPGTISWKSLVQRLELLQSLWQQVQHAFHSSCQDAFDRPPRWYQEYEQRVYRATQKAHESIHSLQRQEEEELLYNDVDPPTYKPKIDLVDEIFFSEEKKEEESEAEEEPEIPHVEHDLIGQPMPPTANNPLDEPEEEEEPTTHRKPAEHKNNMDVEAFQEAQREQIEEAIAQMAKQMKDETARIHTTLKGQTQGLLGEMEDLATENVAEVTRVTEDVSNHVSDGWKRTFGTLTLMILVASLFLFSLVTIYMIPKYNSPASAPTTFCRTDVNGKEECFDVNAWLSRQGKQEEEEAENEGDEMQDIDYLDDAENGGDEVQHNEYEEAENEEDEVQDNDYLDDYDRDSEECEMGMDGTCITDESYLEDQDAEELRELLRQQKEKEQLEAERERQAEQLQREEARLEAESLRMEQERMEAERKEVERHRVEAERVEQERIEQERLEAARIEHEQHLLRLEQERLKIEQERLEAERLEQEQYDENEDPHDEMMEEEEGSYDEEDELAQKRQQAQEWRNHEASSDDEEEEGEQPDDEEMTEEERLIEEELRRLEEEGEGEVQQVGEDSDELTQEEKKQLLKEREDRERLNAMRQMQQQGDGNMDMDAMMAERERMKKEREDQLKRLDELREKELQELEEERRKREFWERQKAKNEEKRLERERQLKQQQEEHERERAAAREREEQESQRQEQEHRRRAQEQQQQAQQANAKGFGSFTSDDSAFVEEAKGFESFGADAAYRPRGFKDQQNMKGGFNADLPRGFGSFGKDDSLPEGVAGGRADPFGNKAASSGGAAQAAGGGAESMAPFRGRPFAPRDIRKAATTNDVELLSEYLDERQIWIDKKDKNDWAALHFAVRAGHEEAVKLLIEANADINARTKQGTTALGIAVERVGERHRLTAFLRDNGAEL